MTTSRIRAALGVEAATPAGLVLAGGAPRTCAYSTGAASAQGEVRTFRVDAATRESGST